MFVFSCQSHSWMLMGGSLFSNFFICWEPLLSVSDWELGYRSVAILGILRSTVWNNKCCDSYCLTYTLIQGVVTYFQDKMLKSFSVSNKSLYFDIRNHRVCLPLTFLSAFSLTFKRFLCSTVQPLKGQSVTKKSLRNLFDIQYSIKQMRAKDSGKLKKKQKQ